jgi:hypothetical protein
MKKKVPFRAIQIENDGYHPILKAKVNGKSIMLVIDTGASRTVIDNMCLEGLTPIINEHQEPFAAGVNATQFAVQPFLIPLLKMGEVKLKNVMIFGTDLSQLSELYQKMTGIKIAGLLGCDLLKKYSVKLNFKTNVMSFDCSIDKKNKSSSKKKQALKHQ